MAQVKLSIFLFGIRLIAWSQDITSGSVSTYCRAFAESTVLQEESSLAELDLRGLGLSLHAVSLWSGAFIGLSEFLVLVSHCAS